MAQDTRNIPIRLTPDEIETLDYVAKHENRNRSQQMRRYIQQGLARDLPSLPDRVKAAAGVKR